MCERENQGMSDNFFLLSEKFVVVVDVIMPICVLCFAQLNNFNQPINMFFKILNLIAIFNTHFVTLYNTLVEIARSNVGFDQIPKINQEF